MEGTNQTSLTQAGGDALSAHTRSEVLVQGDALAPDDHAQKEKRKESRGGHDDSAPHSAAVLTTISRFPPHH